MKTERCFYFDHQATTPMDPRVSDAMVPYFSDLFANPHSTTYRQSTLVSRAIEQARSKLAYSVGSKPPEIVFTSGATEANNLAIQGLATPAAKRTKVITQVTEHKSVLDTVKCLAERGFDVSVLPVDRYGIVDLNRLEHLIDHQTLLVSIMLVNNETGVIQPIREVASLCSRHGALFHSDCAQAIGKIPINVEDMNIDLASFSAHKAYGPKGVGALFIRREVWKHIRPLYHGGGQEKGIRPGTLPVPLCIGIGEAFEIASKEQNEYAKKANKQIDDLIDHLANMQINVVFNGQRQSQAPGCLSMTFADHSADDLLSRWRDLEISSGSACESSKNESSHVLKAMKLTRAMAASTLRISVGRFTDDAALNGLKNRLSELSPKGHNKGLV